ncbi:MAG: hypothetical protein QNJ00_09090 [Woeseiaceae bacterium]|nr:hypothetical protein [Woeseiaceae bacterium]
MNRLRPVEGMPLFKWLDDDHVTRLYVSLGLFMIASLVVFIPAMILDQRMLDSSPVWIKPQKFNLSLALHALTLAVLVQLVPRDVRNGWALMVFSYLAAAALIFEYLVITIQAGRARRSHFNFETQIEALVYAAMGIGAVLLVLVALVLAIQIWRKGDRSRPGVWLGSIIGLSLGFAVTLVFASYMSNTGRYVGGPLEGGGAVIPLFGWSREYGDLRPAHFVSLHMMQTVPFAGWLADRKNWNAKLVVLSVAGVQVALATFLFFQARAGQPIWPV